MIMRTRKINSIHIYSLRDGGYAIEVTIGGVKIGPRTLSREDVMALNDKTDRRRLAEKYFNDWEEE